MLPHQDPEIVNRATALFRPDADHTELTSIGTEASRRIMAEHPMELARLNAAQTQIVLNLMGQAFSAGVGLGAQACKQVLTGEIAR